MITLKELLILFGILSVFTLTIALDMVVLVVVAVLIVLFVLSSIVFYMQSMRLLDSIREYLAMRIIRKSWNNIIEFMKEDKAVSPER